MVDQTDPWMTEPDDSKPLGDGLDVENITPEIPKDLWDSFAWRAIRRAFQVSATKDDVFKRLKVWNKDNNPQLLKKNSSRRQSGLSVTLTTNFAIPRE